MRKTICSGRYTVSSNIELPCSLTPLKKTSQIKVLIFSINFFLPMGTSPEGQEKIINKNSKNAAATTTTSFMIAEAGFFTG